MPVIVLVDYNCVFREIEDFGCYGVMVMSQPVATVITKKSL